MSADEGDGVLRLPGASGPIVTVDLDGDGSREVVRGLTEAHPGHDPTHVSLDIWTDDAATGWVRAASTALQRELPNGGETVPITTATDAFGLLAVHVAGRERVLLVTAPQPMSQDPSVVGVCCVEVKEIDLAAGRIGFRPVTEFEGTADAITATDMDGDGTDELVVSSAPGPGGLPQMTVLRWEGSSFVALDPIEVGTAPYTAYPGALGDSDGVAGDDLVFGPFDDGSITRVSMTPTGSLHVDRASWVQGTSFHQFFVAIDGTLYAQSDRVLSMWRWPRGGQPEVLTEGSPSESFVVGVLASAGHVAVVLADRTGSPDAPLIVRRVHESAPDVVVQPSRAATAAMELVNDHASVFSDPELPAYPYSGPLSGYGQGIASTTFVGMGNLITLGPSGEITVEDVGSFAGVYPAGRAGLGDRSMVVARAYFAGGRTVFLFAGAFFGGAAYLAPMEALLTPEGNPGEVIAAADTARPAPGGGGPLYVGPAGLDVTARAPSGSVAVGLVGSSAVFEGTFVEASMAFELAPRRGQEGNRRHEGTVLVVTPTGHTYVRSWEFVVVRDPPELEARAQTRLGELAAAVRGRASEHATVEVDGAPARMGDDGSFEHVLHATPWPRDVRVVARDPLGNETAVQLTVVGLFDYRTLPWVPIAAALTVTLGAVLFLRTPRPAKHPDSADDGVLEDLDGASGSSGRGATRRELDEGVQGGRIGE